MIRLLFTLPSGHCHITIGARRNLTVTAEAWADLSSSEPVIVPTKLAICPYTQRPALDGLRFGSVEFYNVVVSGHCVEFCISRGEYVEAEGVVMERAVWEELCAGAVEARAA